MLKFAVVGCGNLALRYSIPAIMNSVIVNCCVYHEALNLKKEKINIKSPSKHLLKGAGQI